MAALSKTKATLKRLATLTQMGWAGLKISKAADDAAKEAARRTLAGLLANARGAPLKIGQFLATLPDHETYKALPKGVPALPLTDMQCVMDAAYENKASEVFATIEEATAAASLGQVHKAQLKTGETVAVKIQYPHVLAATQTELKLLGLMPGMGPVKKWGFDMAGYQAMFEHQLAEELDYLSEARRQLQFGQQNIVPGLKVPKVYKDLCRPLVLVQEWVAGQSLEEAALWPTNQKRAAAQTLLHTFFKSLFETGLLHTDPHEGNVFFGLDPNNKPQVTLLDYGATLDIPQPARLALLKLILGARGETPASPMACLAQMGFDPEKLKDIAHALPPLCALIFEPFLHNRPFATKTWEVGPRTDALLGDYKWYFRAAGPPELFMIMRAFQGMCNQLETLGVGLNWQETLHQAVSPEVFKEAQAFTPPPVHLEKEAPVKFGQMAAHLKVEVTENGNPVVALSLPVHTVPELKDQMPENVLEEIQKQNIDLDGILQTACLSGLTPQNLFALEAGNRKYKVWLQ